MATDARADNRARSLDEVIDGHRFAMVTTSTPQGLTARPLTLLEQEGSVLRFLVSTDAEWVQQVGRGLRSIQVSFVSPQDSTYVALLGRASVDPARESVERLWSPAAKSSFDGPGDPSAAVLEANIHDGEWWDAPSSKVGMAIALAKRTITGGEPGEHGSVDPER